MGNAPVPTSRRCRRTVAIARSLPVAVILSLLGGAACGSEDEPVSGVPAREPACQRLERLFADVRAGAQPGDAVEEARAVLAALHDPAPRGLRGVAPGGRVPRSLAGPASVLARAGSAPEEDVEAALGDVARWFGEQCLGPITVEGREDRRLLASPPPADLPLCLALDTAEAFALHRPTAPAPDAADRAIWGDASAPDPWAATVVWLQTARTDRVPVHEDATPATVGGRPALVAPAPLFQAVSSAAWGHIVSWRARPGLVAEVAVRRGSPMDALRVAELVRFDGSRPSLPAEAVGPRTEPLFDGIPPSPLGIDAQALWWVVYGRQQIRVLGHAPVDRDALRALEFWTVHSEPRTVRGQPAILYAAFDAETGPWGVAWIEPDGLLVQVVGFAPQEAVVELASSLVDVSPAEWRAAKTAAEPCDDDTP